MRLRESGGKKVVRAWQGGVVSIACQEVGYDWSNFYPSQKCVLLSTAALLLNHLDERYGDACEESRDEQEEFSAVDVAERSDERRWEETEEALDSHDDPVEEQRIVSKLSVEDLDHRGGDHSPGKELKIQKFKMRK